VLRDGREDEEASKVFGSPESAAELTLTDARVLFLPVRSYSGTFAFITCPLVLERLNRDLRALGLSALKAPTSPQQTEALLAQETEIVHNGKVILEDIDLSAKPGAANDLAEELGRLVFGDEASYFRSRFALVSNDVFSYFCEMGMEIIARVKLDSDSKTVVRGGLWYEEAIPAETVFSSFAIGTNGFEELNRPYLQLGGQASVGRGLLRRLGGGV
jgi:CRISPR-associated protein Cmr4